MTEDYKDGIAPSGRAATLEAYGRIMHSLGTEEGLNTGLSLVLRPTDVVITPFAKSGTTWLQQMAHSLRTRGDMDFDDISRVVPWIETSTDLGIDLNAEQKAHPRLFKSHLNAQRIPKGGKYINSCRDPKDALYSMFKFMEGWFIEPGTITVDEFAEHIFIARASRDAEGEDYWSHLKSWWHRRADPDVLFMAYEHMQEDLEQTIRRVAAFIDVPLDAELLAITLEHSSVPFMQRHKDHFDDKLMLRQSIDALGLPEDSDSAKIRRGKVGDSRGHLSEAVLEQLDAMWQKHITPDLGFESYTALISRLGAED